MFLRVPTRGFDPLHRESDIDSQSMREEWVAAVKQQLGMLL